jgi:hypothetical protein
VLKSLLGERDLQRALFSADGYGQGPKAQDDVGLGAIGVEQGTQAGYEGNDPDRHFIRAETVLTCETFGRPIRPGCLNDAINATRAGAGERSGGGDNSAHGGSNDGNDGNGGEGGGAPQPGPGAAGDLGDQLGQTLNGAGGDVGEILDQVGGVVGDGLGGDKPGRDHGGSSNLGAAEDLLDFLAGP